VDCLQSGVRFLPLYVALACVAVFAVLEVLIRLRLESNRAPFREACSTTQAISDYKGGTAGLDGQFI
jgi:hypothetical protein